MSVLPLHILKAGAYEIGVELSDEQLGAMDAFAALMLDTNSKFNLTRITDPASIVSKHFLDSLLCLKAGDIPCGASVIDVGTGAGFPGMALKLARPDLSLTLVDATLKKVRFLEQAVEVLKLTRIEVVHGRAECLAHEKNLREQFDIVCTRALAELRIVCELCLPFARIGGRLIASKSKDIDEEIEGARPIIGQLGGRIDRVVQANIPGTDIVRSLVVLNKAKPTPGNFPRAYTRIRRGS